jgi:hypothetical protein
VLQVLQDLKVMQDLKDLKELRDLREILDLKEKQGQLGLREMMDLLDPRER